LGRGLAHPIVEADGGQHGIQQDQKRDVYLQAQGFRVLRFWNNEIFTNEEGVITRILDALEAPLPNASPRRGAQEVFHG
jgi:very-short-patch-repair endonuclease